MNFASLLYHIRTNTILTDHHASDSSVDSGGKLIITDTVYVKPGTKIVVKPGGKLVVDNGAFIGLCLWKGIEVWGNAFQGQSYAYQGAVQVINGGTIQNALCAIQTIGFLDPQDGSGEIPNYSMTGGMINTDDANFINNRIAIKFWKYNYEDSYSFIKYTNFITNDDMLPGTDPETYIVIDEIDGVDIYASNFTDEHMVTSPDELLTGIETFNATFKVTSYVGTASYFSNLYYGIKALVNNPLKKPQIFNNQFTGNYRSVYTSGISNAEVTNNNFEINTPFVENGGYGLYLDECTAYTIEENNFYHSIQTATGVGLIVNESGGDPNEIYRNYFINLECGINAQGKNRAKGGTGLVLRCNTYDETEMDKIITWDGMFLSGLEGIAKDQGFVSEEPQANEMAGNLFQDDGPPYIDNDDINNQANSLTYHRPQNYNTLYENVVPKDYSSTVTINPVFIPGGIQWTYENGCPPSDEPGGGGGSEELRGTINESETNINTAEATLAVLIDGGDTEALSSEVETSLPPETIQVYNELMNNSPYLSDTVVESAIEKEDVLPNAMLRDIMVANPHTAKSEELINKLNERWDPLPEYMKAQILQGKSIVSIREELESELAGYRQQKARAFNRLVKYYLNDTVNPDLSSDSLLLLYQDDNSLNSKYNLVMLHFERGETQTALNVLNNIPNQFSLVDEDLTNHQQMISFCNIYADLLNAGEALTGADSSQIEQLIQLEASQQGKASAYARNVLVALDEINYEEPILLPDYSKSAQAYDEFMELINTQAPKMLEVYPNPSDDYVVISYKLEMEKPGYAVEISDLNGFNQKTIDVAGKQNQYAIDIMDWKPGVYIVTLLLNGNPIESVKFTVL